MRKIALLIRLCFVRFRYLSWWCHSTNKKTQVSMEQTPSLRLPSRGCPILMHLYCWVLQTIDLFGLTFNQGSNYRAFALLGRSSLLYITWERLVRFVLRLSIRLRVWFWSFDGWLTQYMLLCRSYISLGKHIISLPILLLSIVTSHNITVDMTAYWLACQLADNV